MQQGFQTPMTKQLQTAMFCPKKCQPVQVLFTQPKPGEIIPLASRCLHCLTYWVTNIAGEITTLRLVPQQPACTRCFEPLDKDALHMCKKGV